MPRSASDWLVLSESGQPHLPACSSSWQCVFLELSKLTIPQVLTDGWIDHWVDSLDPFSPIWTSICTPGVLRSSPLFCLVTWQWLLTFLWSECPDAGSQLGCVFLIAGEWNCSWKSSSIFVPWLLRFCIIRQSFSLWFPEMASFSLLPKTPALYFCLLLPLPCIHGSWYAHLAFTTLWTPWVQGQCLIQLWWSTAFNLVCGTWDVSQKEFLNEWMSE